MLKFRPTIIIWTKLYALWKKSSVRQNFVRSDKISNSVRPMSDKTPEYFDSTANTLLNCTDITLTAWKPIVDTYPHYISIRVHCEYTCKLVKYCNWSVYVKNYVLDDYHYVTAPAQMDYKIIYNVVLGGYVIGIDRIFQHSFTKRK